MLTCNAIAECIGVISTKQKQFSVQNFQLFSEVVMLWVCIVRVQRHICFGAFMVSIGKLYLNLCGSMSCRYGIAFEVIHL